MIYISYILPNAELKALRVTAGRAVLPMKAALKARAVTKRLTVSPLQHLTSDVFVKYVVVVGCAVL